MPTTVNGTADDAGTIESAGPPAPAVDGATVLRLRTLTYLEEGDEVTVGCAEIESYLVLDADGAALLRRLEDGLSLDEAAAWYRREYNESVDVFDLAAGLEELGLLLAADEGPAAAPEPVRWQRLGQAVFSPVGGVLMAILVAAGIFAMIRTPALVPGNHDIFFTKYVTVIELVLFLGQFPLMLLHESFHALAGRRLGLHSTLSIGRRLYYIVFLTALDGLVTVPRRKRYLPMLAGLLCDALVVSALTLVAGQLLGPGGRTTLPAGICLALAYSTLLRMAWQACLFLQTDLYYVVVTVFGCVQLQAAARSMLRDRWNRLLGRTDRIGDPEQWHPRDRAVARWYSWLLVVGYGASTASLVFMVLPVTYRALASVLDRLWHPAGQGAAGLADTAVFLLLNVGQFVFLGWLVHRERVAGRRAAQGTATP